MVKNRQRVNSLDSLAAVIANGSPAGVLQPLPRYRRPASTEARRAVSVVRVLDIRQVSLTAPNARRVSVLISNDSGSLLAMGLVGNLMGLRSNGPYAGECLEEQVIELTGSDVYRRGQRKWFACPGLAGRPCGTKRMKLYLPPGECAFACADCHQIDVPHATDRPLRWRGAPCRQQVLHWHEPLEMSTPRSA